MTNRIQKILEDANLKLSSVASDTVGASGLAILAAIIAGQENPEELANMARGKLRKKIPELVMALQGRVTSHHRFMLQHLLNHLRFLQSQIGQLEAEIGRKLEEESEQVDRLCTIPGVDGITASALIAEIGLDMDRFPSQRHLASWAGLCPGNAESAGKRLSGATPKGSPSLCRSLCQVAWVVSRSKHTYFAALSKRIASRRGLKKAVIAVAHAMLVAVYFILKRRENYRELGFDYFDRQNTGRIKRSLVKRLERLGHTVVVTPTLRDA